MSCDACVLTVEGSTFVGNNASASGGAVFMTGANASLTLSSSTFTNNRALQYARRRNRPTAR